MDVLIAEAIDEDVVRWLNTRHRVTYAPELAASTRRWHELLHVAQAAVLPPAIAIDAGLLRAAPRLVAIGRVSAAVETVDVAACRAAGVEVVRSLAATARAEAEFVIGALLSLLRRVPIVTSDGMRVGRELGATTVGLVGMPPSARALARLLIGFGARPLGYDPSVHASDALWERWRVQPTGLHELLAAADALCVMLPAYSRYQGLLGERFLALCKRNQVVVCIGHCGVFDETALAAAMASGRITAAWFDGLEPGMLDDGRPLADVDTLQVTPCVASTTRESRLRSAWAVVRRIDQVLNERAAESGTARASAEAPVSAGAAGASAEAPMSAGAAGAAGTAGAATDSSATASGAGAGAGSSTGTGPGADAPMRRSADAVTGPATVPALQATARPDAAAPLSARPQSVFAAPEDAQASR